jgi:hypothetical protein
MGKPSRARTITLLAHTPIAGVTVFLGHPNSACGPSPNTVMPRVVARIYRELRRCPVTLGLKQLRHAFKLRESLTAFELSLHSVCTQFELSGLGLCIPKMVVSTRKAKTGEGGIKISGFHGQHQFLGRVTACWRTLLCWPRGQARRTRSRRLSIWCAPSPTGARSD